MASVGQVLLADDDPIMLETGSKRLRRLGYECATAPDGETALALLATREFDVLVTDIGMPGNADLALVQQAQSHWPGLPVVIITGQPTFETAHAALGLGVRAYLLKPFTGADLAREVAAAVQLRRLWRAAATVRDELTEADEPWLRRRLWEMTSALVALGAQQAASPTPPGGQGGLGETLDAAELVAALREVVEVLEATKGAFRSKLLGRLRQRLETLLERLGPTAAP